MSRRARFALITLLAVALALPWAAGARQAAPQEGVQAGLPEEAQAAPLDQRLPVGPKVMVGQFANGLRYYIRENERPENRAELRLVVNAGSVLEDDDQLGLAHLLEHMAFNGTEHFEKHELIEFMESIGMRLGPDVNAYTSFDETVYMLQVPTDTPDYMATAFQILEDWAHAVTLEDEEIDKERGVVVEEWRLGQGAFRRVQDKQFPIIFAGSRYAERLPIGTKESIETSEHEVLRRFYRDWYRPDLMAVVAVGDFDAGEVEALVRQHFEELPPTAETRLRPTYEVPDHPETLFAIASDDELPNTMVVVYHKLPIGDESTVGAYREGIVGRLYNDMLNRRFQELAQQADPPFAFGSSSKGRLIRTKGMYTLAAGVPPDGIGRGLEALLTESSRVARHGFTGTELERAKARVLRSMERAYANRETQLSRIYASEYIRAYLQGEPIPGIEYEFALYERFIPGITLEEVNQVGRDWISDESRVVVVSAPETEGVAVPGEDELLAVLEAAATKEVAAYEDTVSDQPLLAEIPDASPIVETNAVEALDITEWRLANGVRVVLKPTDFREDEILVRAISPGGTSLLTDEDYAAAGSAAQVVRIGGLGEFNNIDLQKLMAGKAARVTPSISTSLESLNGSASPKDLETLFQLIYLTFTAPRADPTAFSAYKAQMKAALANRNASPQFALAEEIQKIMTQSHPRARMLTGEVVDEYDLDKSFAFYKDRFADASDFTFIFVGKLDLGTMRPLVERYLGALPSIGRQETWRDVGIRNPTGVITSEVHKGIEPQSQTQIIFTGPFVYDRQHRTTIRAMAQLLQTKLRDILREELGGTYSVSAGASYQWNPVEQYRVSIRFGSAPERAEELAATVFEEIDKLKSAGPTQDEVADVKEQFLRTHETDTERNGWWLSQLAGKYQRNEDPSDLAIFGESVEVLTAAMIQEAAQTYFDNENFVWVTLLPEQSDESASLRREREMTFSIAALMRR